MSWKRGMCAVALLALAGGVTVYLAVTAINRPAAAANAQADLEAYSPRSPNIPEVLTREKADDGTVRMMIHAEELPQNSIIEITTPGRTVLQTLTVNAQHEAVTNGLQPGQYLAISQQIGAVLFALHDNASVAVLGGNGWSDGEAVYMTTEQTGTVQVKRYINVDAVTADQVLCYTYTLSGQGITTDHILRFTTASSQAGGYYAGTCTFGGLAEGSYELWENGKLLQTVDVSTESAAVVELYP